MPAFKNLAAFPANFLHAPVPRGGIPRRHFNVRHAQGQQLAALIAQPLAGRFVHIQKTTRLRIRHLKGVVGAVDQGAEQEQGGLGPPAFFPEALLFQGAGNRAAQPRQPVLEQVIGGPLPHRLHRHILAHRARNQEERDVQAALLQQLPPLSSR